MRILINYSFCKYWIIKQIITKQKITKIKYDYPIIDFQEIECCVEIFVINNYNS